ncbi:N-acetyltransferase [Devosia pacifica]|uniref:N-acetyltransferase n=1 Tax=Devosia pacifica TaxID=1335967 RepID=A0A918VN43_9HYPH|nr:GNAT family protein [Devosia pacifica]GHA14437.1 N-acetyltransferase [Devosia pacifica]
MLEPTYPLLTDRLVLRPFTRADLDPVYAYRGRPDVAEYLFDGPLNREQCADAIHNRTAQTHLERDGDRIVLAAVIASENTLIGEMSLICKSQASQQAEIGWILHPEYQGKGYGFEAAAALLDLAFANEHFHRVMARCDTRNISSFKLMERLGMRREAHFQQHEIFKGGWAEEYVYAILGAEWRGRPR